MNKLDLIFKDKMDAILLPIKKRKVFTAITAALTNAEEELAQAKLDYEKCLAGLATCEDISTSLKNATVFKQKIKTITTGIEALNSLKADLESEVEVEIEDEKK